MGEGHTKRILVLLTALAASAPTGSFAGEYRIQSRAGWESWAFPAGIVELHEDGSISLKRFRKNINAVANAAEFEHRSKDAGGLVAGGLRNAGSSQGTAGRAIDGDSQTWWQPSIEDALEDWWLEIDLGRSVLANKVRIAFPDGAAVKPFRN